MDATQFSRVIKPQEGFQEDFLSSTADIVIGGGAAGAGKTFVTLLEPLRNKDNKEFTTVYFRRNIPQITMQGGLRDESLKLYPSFGAKFSNQSLKWYFPSGMTVKFTHLEHEQTVYNHQGAQYALIIFDELTHFSKFQFFYLMTRNRSMSGVKPYMRATCNPDPDSWLAEFLEWWIEQDPKHPNYGFPVPERAGKVRYMVAYNDDIIWGNSKAEVYNLVPKEFWDKIPKDINPAEMIKSVTFIPGSIYQNKELLKINPAYLGNLMAQDEQTKSQLLDGNWKVRNDGNSLYHHQAIQDLFTNYAAPSNFRCITCDAARFGKDLAVIYVWKGWMVTKIIILTKCDDNMIYEAIEAERKRFQIPVSRVVVDQDGVGAGVVRLGKYVGFSGDGQVVLVPELKKGKDKKKENYKNLKTQCYYRTAERVNNGEVAIAVSNDTVVVDGVYTAKIMYKGKLIKVEELIARHLRSIKIVPVLEGKKQINTKEEQKLIAGGSPDMADTLMMREYLDLTKTEMNVSEPDDDGEVSPLDLLDFD